jgi:hypothetical protein
MIMRRFRLALCLSIALTAFGCGVQPAGKVDAKRIPALHAHFEPEHAYDAPADERRWATQSPGLHATFGDTGRSYLRSEVPLLRDLDALRHETQPPARYTEASLVKTLEAEGIGRPSTYASIIGTISDRGYVDRVSNQLVPTFTAFAVTTLLERHFPHTGGDLNELPNRPAVL